MPAWQTGEMHRHVNARITEGEIYGAPVPGGWPDKGPFRILGDALGRRFGRRSSKNNAKSERPANNEPPGNPPTREEPE